MSMLYELWFWLLVIGLIIIITSFIVVTIRYPLLWWIWLIIFLGIVFCMFAFMYGMMRPYFIAPPSYARSEIEYQRPLPPAYSSPLIEPINIR